jgi:hypothetical protein
MFLVKLAIKKMIYFNFILSPNMVYPMHGSCIDNSLFSKYTEDIMKNDFAYSGILLGQKLDTTIS